ncbi:MAG: hypothetical protein QXR53_00235 [Candidatus Norongarragalinales archaeon]
MGNKIGEFFKAQKTILSRKAYFALSALSAIFFAWLFVTLTSIPGQSFESWLYSANNTMKTFVATASVLLGLILATQVFVFRNYRFTMHEAKSGGGALGAFATGVIATACCSPVTAGLLGIAGFAGAGSFILKYEVEATLFATIVLAASLYYSSKIVFCEECRVKTSAFQKPSGFKPKA